MKRRYAVIAAVVVLEDDGTSHMGTTPDLKVEQRAEGGEGSIILGPVALTVCDDLAGVMRWAEQPPTHIGGLRDSLRNYLERLMDAAADISPGGWWMGKGKPE